MLGRRRRFDALGKGRPGVRHSYCTHGLRRRRLYLGLVRRLTDDERRKTNFLYLIAGFGYTLQLTALGFLFGVIIGLILAMLGRSHNPVLRSLVRGYITLARSIPTFVLLLWVYYALPVLMQSLPPEVSD